MLGPGIDAGISRQSLSFVEEVGMSCESKQMLHYNVSLLNFPTRSNNSMYPDKHAINT
jgi:hypothetical protein